MTANNSASSLSIYLLAGVATTTCAFNECRKKLDKLFRDDGVEPHIHVLFPYGDASRSVVRQVLEVRSDLSNRITAGRIGGRRAFQHIKQLNENGKRMLLIGHSGGGAAAYQAAKMMEEYGEDNDIRIVQVGSPKTPIHPKLQARVSYFHSIDGTGKLNDPISRIGSWGGWTAAGRAMPRWNRLKFAPGYVEGIPTVGGHADYFRHTKPYTDEQAICNLDKTIDSVHGWLKGWL
jgi:hypothetical protein